MTFGGSTGNRRLFGIAGGGLLALAVVIFLVRALLPVRVTIEGLSPEDTAFPPLPAGYRAVTGHHAPARASAGSGVTIRMRTIVGTTDAPEEAGGRAGGTELFVISRELLFPVRAEGAPSEPLSAAARDELRRLEAAFGTPLALLASRDFPAGTFALRDGSADPGKPGYPFVRTRFAECSFSRPRYRLDLADWLARAFPRPAKQRVVFIGAVGDMMLARGTDRILSGTSGPERVFTNALPVLRQNDIMIGNLEGTITGASAKAQKTYTFRFSPAVLPALRKAGFTYLVMTNNHSFDYGLQGFTDTLGAVRSAGFASSGAGLSLAEAETPWRTEIAGQRFSVISCGSYPVESTGFDGSKTAAARADRAGILWESDRVLDLVRGERAGGAFVIVNVHGGAEYVQTPTARQRSFYRGLCDAGAGAVFGSHPHVLQPVETYGNSLIAWSLGNFVFPGMDEMEGAEDSLILRLGVIDGRIVYREEYPARLSGASVSLAGKR